MAFVPVANTLMIEFRMTVADQQVENTLYARAPAPPSYNGAVALAGILETWWETYMAPTLSQGISLHEIYITDLTSANSFTVTHTVSPVIPGTVANAVLPNNVALAVSFRTAQRGRSYRGRNYICGLAENQVTDSTVNGAVSTALIGAYNQFKIALDAEIYEWVVVSRYSAGQPRTNGIATPVTAVAVVDLTVDSQRRRLPGRGK